MKNKNVGISYQIGILVFLGAVLLFFVLSCATTKEQKEGRAGIKGTIIPVDLKGEEIKEQDKKKIVINCIPVKEGLQLQDNSVTGNARDNGNFELDLRYGEYVVEIFLEGFYVESFYVVLNSGKRKNLGEIMIKRIEPGSGIPLKDDEFEEVIINEGDVNIQPPS
jgi:hypothetical protein